MNQPDLRGPGVTAIDVDGISVPVSNLDKVLWPETGFTKGEMIQYYVRIAPSLLPHLAGRPLTLGRFPTGAERDGFAQTECRGAPDWMRTAEVRLRSGEIRRQCLATNPASLAWMANQNAIELHIFTWTLEDPEHPAELIFDLDPGPGADVLTAARVALPLRDELRGFGLDPVVKTSGSLGLHVVAALRTAWTFERAKGFARALSELMAERHPDLVVASSGRSLRAGKVLLDWLQNDRSRTTIAPYSLRATPLPTVSTPVTWAEVEEAVRRPRPGALTFLPADVLDRVGARSGQGPPPGSDPCRV